MSTSLAHITTTAKIGTHFIFSPPIRAIWGLNAHPANRPGQQKLPLSPRTYNWRPPKAAKRTRKSDTDLTVVSLCIELCYTVLIMRLVSLQVAKFAICNSCRRPPPPILSTIVMESSDGVYWIADLSLETS